VRDDGHGKGEDRADQEDQSELGDPSDNESAKGSRPRFGGRSGRGGRELARLASRSGPGGRAHACQNPSAKLWREYQDKLGRELFVDCVLGIVHVSDSATPLVLRRVADSASRVLFGRSRSGGSGPA
jgi:hypothetical protein